MGANKEERALWGAGERRDERREKAAAAPHSLPSEASQMRAFGCAASRRRLLKRLELKRMLRRYWRAAGAGGRDLRSVCLYELERMAAEANRHLAAALGEFARADLAAGGACWRRDEHAERQFEQWARARRRLQWRVSAASSSSWSSSSSSASDNSAEDADSGVLSAASNEATFGSVDGDHRARVARDRPATRANKPAAAPFAKKRKLRLLARHFELRASGPMRRVVGFSCDLFAQLLASSHLLQLQVEPLEAPSPSPPRPSITLSQLKLFACVECQKLRAVLRFDWLAKCLWFAFDNYGAPEAASGAGELPLLEASRAPDCARRRKHLDLLMGRLLRDHFLERALDAWQRVIARHLEAAAAAAAPWNCAPKLVVPVELRELAGGRLAASEPGALIGEALAFVARELVAIASDLPRAMSSGGGGGELLVALPPGDDLLARKLAALDAELAAGRPGAPSSWVPREYLRMIATVNKFRANEVAELEQLEELGEEFELASEKDEQAEAANGKLVELRAARKQVRLLERLERELSCKLARFRDFGQLVRLDCKQLNEQLSRVIGAERSLLIRLHVDDILKQLEALRLHLDELELSVDLESALEDYLSKRWQIKQSQQPDLEAQLLLDGNMEALDLAEEEALLHDGHERQLAELVRARELDNGAAAAAAANEASAPLDSPGGQSINQPINRLEKQASCEGPAGEEAEEVFANALVGNNNPNVAHLFALSNPNGVPLGEMVASGELGVGSRGLAPLVECRLLLGRYEYLHNFLLNELAPFQQNARFVLEQGLAFVLEHLPTLSTNFGQLERRQLDGAQLELVRELVLRKREFGQMLAEARRRLDGARAKLRVSNELRSSVLNRSCLEFDWLMGQLASKQLATLRNPTGGGGSSDDLTRSNIKHLDLIQDIASWAQKLELRRDFLTSQSELLHKEAKLLLACDQFQFQLGGEQLQAAAGAEVKKLDQLDTSNEQFEREFELRNGLVNQWGRFVGLTSAFWRLVDAFETQQVKWLNSDSKKLDFERIKRTFELEFAANLRCLTKQVRALQASASSELDFRQLKWRVLGENMLELERSFEEFARKYLPIFKFLTNKHLMQEHWIKLNQLINRLAQGGEAQAQVSLAELQLCSTAAQLLELNVQQFVGELDEMSRQATIEHELSSLIELEKAHFEQLARRQQRDGRSWAAAAPPPLEGQLRSLAICARLDDWKERELVLAAGRFIEFRLGGANRAPSQHAVELNAGSLARQLVGCHALVKRFLKLRGELNLMLVASKASVATQAFDGEQERDNDNAKPALDQQEVRMARASQRVLVLRSNTLLSTSRQVSSALLLEFLRLFTQTWLETSAKMAARLDRAQQRLASAQEHLSDIDELLEQVKRLSRTELRQAGWESERGLSELQRNSMSLELEREILATREALALERQREALKARDVCIRQVSERAIPAIRAATRALDCLGDGRSLRALRSYRPRPPLAIRLVIEAVCLLRNASCAAVANGPRMGERHSVVSNLSSGDLRASGNGNLAAPHERKGNALATTATYSTSPMRHFDALRGQIIEDYWPVAWRTLNGLHSTRLIADLRQVSKRPIPRHIIQFIRRKYLSRAEFQVATIERISLEAGHLARWLIAVDVFDRVINIVRPNYEQYLSSERNLGALLAEVGHKRHQINSIGRQLEQMQELIHKQVRKQATLVDLMADCGVGSRKLQQTRRELELERQKAADSIGRLRAQMQRLARKCLWQTTRLIYLNALEEDDRAPLERLLRRKINAGNHSG